MKKSLLALASGAFILGAAEFVMMGILPQAAAATGVDIPTAGHYISAYAIGVCFGTLILVFGRKVPPKDLIILFMVIALVGNLASAFSVNAAMLVAARFVAGLPHGAFSGGGRHSHTHRQDSGGGRQGGAGRIRDGHRTDRGQYARRTGGHLDGRVPFLASCLRHFGRLGGNDDCAGVGVDSVRCTDQGRRHRRPGQVRHPPWPPCSPAMPVCSAGGATSPLGCRKPADGRLPWCRC